MPWPLTAGAVVAGAIVVVPLAYLVVRASERGWAGVGETIWRDRTVDLVARTLGLAAAVTAASLVIGVAAAWLVTRTDVPLRRVWTVVLALPLAVPSYVSAWAWIGWRPAWDGFTGAFVVLTSVSYPYVYLPVLGALRRCDPALEEVARTLGRGPAEVFLAVTLRQVRVAATGGALLVGLYVMSDFGAVSIMRFESLTHVIYRSYRASFDRTPAAVLGCLLAVLALAMVAVEARTRRHDRYAPVGAGAPRPPGVVRLGRGRWLGLAGCTLLVGISLAVPAGNLVRWMRRGRSVTDWPELVDAAGASLWLAGWASLVTVAVALPVAVLSARHPGRLAGGVTAAAYAGHALPGIVVALALVFFGVRVATPVYQRTPLLVFAYVVLFLSLAVGALHSAVARCPPVLEDVARTLGRTRWGAWRSVLVPLAAPGLGTAATLVFLTVLKELPATLLLRPIGLDTLATRLWTLTDAASFSAAAPYAMAIVLLATVPTAALTAGRTAG